MIPGEFNSKFNAFMFPFAAAIWSGVLPIYNKIKLNWNVNYTILNIDLGVEAKDNIQDIQIGRTGS
jgi:hypothetical protein